MPERSCRICAGPVDEFLDLGQQPLSDAFRDPSSTDEEFTFHLVVVVCRDCSMVQMRDEVPRTMMFHEAYPYLSSGSETMRAHFSAVADRFLATELTGPDPFVVEVGCNDGVMLQRIAREGVRHLGVEPSGGVADVAAEKGIRLRKSFFEESTALEILDRDGPADVVYAANTMCHIPYIDSVLRGVDALLGPSGIFVFEDPYLGDVVSLRSFDQIYDEHFYLFSARSVQAMVAGAGLELVDVERLPVHGGEVRYTIARPGSRPRSPRVDELLAEEESRGLVEPETLKRFAADVDAICDDLRQLLERLRDEGRAVAGFGATAKSATVLNYARIGPDLVPFVCDSTPAKQGRLTPGSHIPVRPPEAFTDPYPDYAVLFAWNHEREIRERNRAFADAGGRWITYVPEVRIR